MRLCTTQVCGVQNPRVTRGPINQGFDSIVENWLSDSRVIYNNVRSVNSVVVLKTIKLLRKTSPFEVIYMQFVWYVAVQL